MSSTSTASTKADKKTCSSSNPFAFGCMSKMMAFQDKWRRNPSPANISFESMGDNDAIWLMLLMAEDEFARYVRQVKVKV